MTNTFEVEGKEYSLKLGFNTVAEMERKTKTPLSKMPEKGDINYIITMFHYGLKHQEKTMTADRAGDLLESYISEGGTLEELATIAGDAMKSVTGGNAVPTEE